MVDADISGHEICNPWSRALPIVHRAMGTDYKSMSE